MSDPQFKGPRNTDFERRAVYSPGVNEIHGIDLMDLSQKKTKWKYLFVCIDIYSRFCHVVKMTNKTSVSIQNALKECWEVIGKPQKIWSDMEAGLESNENKEFLSKNNVHLYHTENSYIGPGSHANPIVERMNKTIKESFVEKESGTFTNMIQKGIDKVNTEYNERVHRTLGTTPAEVMADNVDISQDQIERLNKPKTRGKRFHNGDQVLLQKKKENIEKKYQNTYEGPYTITEIKTTKPITYVLDKKKGTFYGQQLKKYIPNKHIRIEDADTDNETDDTYIEQSESSMTLRNGKKKINNLFKN